MKKLLKFGIASLSLAVLASAGLVAEPTVLADTNVVVTTPAVDEGTMLIVSYHGPSEGALPNIIKDDDYIYPAFKLGEPLTVTAPQIEGFVFDEGITSADDVNDIYFNEPSITIIPTTKQVGVAFFYKEASSAGDTNQVTPPIDNGGGDADNQTPPKEDGAVTDNPMPEPQPETPQDPSAKEMAAVITEIENLVTELVSLGGTPRHYLPEVIEKVKAGDVQAYKAYDFTNIKAGLLEQIAEAKKVTETPAPKVLTDQDLATFAEVARLYDEVIALGGKPWDQLHLIAEIAKSGDKERMTSVLNSYENIRGFVTRLENQLAELKKTPETPAPKDLAADRNKLLLSVDESGLTDQQKGELAIKITFAETEKDLADLKAELVKLVKAAEKPANKPAKEASKTESKAPAVAAKPAANTPGKSDKAALPATGDVTRVGLIAAGFSLLLLGLGLAKSRKHN